MHVPTQYPFSAFPARSEEQQQRATTLFKKKNPNDCFFRNDAEFDWLYPEHLQSLSQKQWTPVAIARKAAEYLAVKGAKVLDVGSGIGKFCLTAAHFYPDSFYFGVEQRHELVHYAQTTQKYLDINNVSFIHANITQVNFHQFDHFYFYNSFFENLDQENAIDDHIETSYGLYAYYSRYLKSMLNDKPSGTRVVTYQSFGEIIPIDYSMKDLAYDSLLQLWVKD